MAQVEDVPRERRPQNSNLKQEVRKRNRLFRVIAPLGIVGVPGTGRKTLAYRFADMDDGVFQQDVPLLYHYAAFLEEEFPPQYSNHHILYQYSRFRVELTIYIIEEPQELDRHQHPLYMEEWDNFCCLVFVFDLKRPTTFCGLMMTLDSFRLQGLRIPVFFIVGNKYDEFLLELSPGTNRSQYEEEADNLGVKYFQCSAKRNIGVEPLLKEIKQLAIAERYWIR